MLKNVVFALTALAIVTAPAIAAECPNHVAKTAAADTKAAPAPAAKAYPLDTCIVTGEKLGKDAVAVVHDGQEFKFCCKACIDKFNADPAKYHAVLKAKTAPKAPGKAS